MPDSPMSSCEKGGHINGTRKYLSKGKGIDWNQSRRNREEETIQVRKQRRFDRANIERRKV